MYNHMIFETCSFPGVQTLPFPSQTRDDARQWIQDEHLTFRLDGPAADVRNAGERLSMFLHGLRWLHGLRYVGASDASECSWTLAGLAWHTTYVEPSLWTQPSPPSLAVQALLPAQNSDGTQVDFREVDLDSPEVSLLLPLKASCRWG